MAGYFRHTIASKLSSFLISSGIVQESQSEKFVKKLATVVKVKKITRKHSLQTDQFQISFKDLKLLFNKDSYKNERFKEKILSSLSQSQPCKEIQISSDDKFLLFGFDPTSITKNVLGAVRNEGSRFGFCSHLHDAVINEDGCTHLTESKNGQTVVVEYSSPNIAKPFHAGHLRSTILGNFISNLYEGMGYKVVRINYLGDWGTQFGLLAAGFYKYGNDEELKSNALQHLFQVYVKVNQDTAHEISTSQTDNPDSMYQQGRQIFQKIEKGDKRYLELWKRFQLLSIEEYKKMYSRLGISFTVYHGESMYSKSAQNLLEDLQALGLLKVDQKSGVGYVDVSNDDASSRVTLSKSDGTTLYLTRDLCAAKDRKEKYNFHKIHYVVDNGQKIHFANLKAVLAKMKESWVLRTGPHFHIGFGRVLGMSTRKGEVVFMKDILDEAQSIMLQKRRETRTTKDVHDEDAVADILGISSILVQDLKERRNRDYKFNWEKCLNFKADSGVFLQYAHARLNSLQLTCGTQLSNQVDYSLLQEQDAFKLVLHICRYDEVLRDTMQTFEPCIVVQYLFQLAHLSNQAHRELLVKGQPEDLAQARLLLFHCTQQVLANGLRLVGVPPLDKM